MELLTISSGPTDIFKLELPFGRPRPLNLFYSLCVHALIVTALFTVTLPDPRTHLAPAEPISPLELHLDGHIYYVAKLDSPSPAAPSDNTRLTLPRSAESGKTPPPAPKSSAPKDAPKEIPKIDLPMPPALTVKSQVPTTTSADAELAATRQLIRREIARTFIPPEVKRNPLATQTLIQPLSPPDLIPKPTPLPSFRVSSPQFPKIPKTFVAPGRKTPLPPAQTPNVPVPNIELVHANPVPTDLQPKLPLPRTPPPPEPAPAPVEGPPPAPQGDGANILSLSDHPIPPNGAIVVPAGNIAQEPGDGSVTQPGSTTSASNTGSPAGTLSPRQTPSNSPSNTGISPVNSPSATANSPSVTVAGTAGNGPGRGASTGGSNIQLLGGSTAAGTPGGTGRGTVGNGIGSALAGATPTGSTTAVAGSVNPGGGTNASGSNGLGANGSGLNNGSGGGRGTGPERFPAGQVVNRPPGGNFDAVVIQSSPVDQYPESRGLLSGRPIYSVYISAGSVRDWTLYFCVPNEKPPVMSGQVVRIDEPATPIRAPYPYKLVRPAVTLPSFEKYVLVHGYVTAEGKVQDMRIVREVLPETDQAILASLSTWEFRAATKDGVPIRVEFLLSIPARGL